MPLDSFVVLLYVAAMLALGWYGMRRAKTREDYLVAGRNLGPGFYLLLGLAVLAIALVVSDVISALTLAYNLLVGGMLIPLLGAIYWKRASTPAAIASMLLGSLTAALFMYRDGLDANTPIYYSLLVSALSFVLLSLLSRRPAALASPA